MASLDDIATIQKNGVIGVNTLNLTLLRIYGTNTSVTVTAPTLIFTGAGRLVTVSVVVGGSATGLIHNATSTTAAAAANALMTVPTTAGVYPANIMFANGLVVVPGTGQSINVTYSAG